MSGLAASWSVLLPTARKLTLAAPTMVIAMISIGRVGAAAAIRMATPKAKLAVMTARVPVRPLLATTRPPITAPAPMAAVRKPYTSAPPPNVSRATMGSTTWNSYASAPITAIIASGIASAGVLAT